MENPNIQTYTPTDHRLKVLLYGSSGAGKTFFSGTAKNALFLSAENGLLSIRDKHPKFWEIKSLADLRKAYAYLKDEQHKYETVVIDSITEISDIIKRGIEKENGHAMQLQDWGLLKSELVNMFRLFRDLPLHVILIAIDDRIVDEDKIHKIVPSLDGKGAVTAIPQYFDIVAYASVDGNGTYHIDTLSNKKYVTKDRSGCIGNDCPTDFEVWKERVQKGYVAEEPKPLKEKLQELMDSMGIKNLTSLNTILGTKLKSLEGLSDKQAENIISQLKETESNLPQ